MTPAVSAAEIRRRLRAHEAVQAKTREIAAGTVLTTRKAAADAATAKEAADLAAREAAAAAVRLFDDAAMVSVLLDIPLEELERDAKAVTAGRAKEVIESLRARAERPGPRRLRSTRSLAAPSPAEDAAPSSDSGGSSAHVV
ncbi:hypothetical protein [Streptomyces exfoliatus]|uniref:hypothetical protein n=1 Tax=Streptomyces exfoliatus TaxID=1905 RepID=UPI000465426B|nr:hypothetical protein [Streptomyces exfoliatus]